MENKKFNQFLYSQPGYPDVDPTARYYFNVYSKLLRILGERQFKGLINLNNMSMFAVCMTGYLQDVIADAGVWRSFIDQCKRMYGKWIPFYDTDENYLEYELNPEDVSFMVWYLIAMCDGDTRNVSPDNPLIQIISDRIYNYFESIYEDAPIPENFRFASELEYHDPEDQDAIYNLGLWLFMHSFLLIPAFSLRLDELLRECLSESEPDMGKVQEKIGIAMNEDTLGPLAYYINEWVHLIITGKLPAAPKEKTPVNSEEHPYYKKVVDAFDGREIVFFRTYEELNRFFIDVLGWDKDEKHLEALSSHGDFVVMVNKEKGMLVAKDVARCVAAPSNELYDKEYARKHSFELLTERGKCPIDLLLKLKENDWLPDATFPGTDTRTLVKDNFDFIARCYLQNYYRGD